jgi:hypothetical protein
MDAKLTRRLLSAEMLDLSLNLTRQICTTVLKAANELTSINVFLR